jgi:hypothetical protein
VIDEDAQFFAQHPDRRARIRLPRKEIVIDPRTRQTRVVNESEGEFWSLGEHEKDRRRILIWRVPEDNPAYHPTKRPLLKIPFLLFADETVEDRDDVLLPIIHEVMMDARERYSR